MNKQNPSLFRAEEFEEAKLSPDSVTCLGIKFPSDDARREYFREELRKKLPELKKIEGFPVGTDDDIIHLSDPPYYTACPNPWLNDFIEEWEKKKVLLENKGKRTSDFNVKQPYALEVKVSKSNPIYTAHTYHTKVPHPAIMRYILHYTQPGDIVLDGFAGTGMTGVAAQACGNPTVKDRTAIDKEWISQFGSQPEWGQRHALCGDLSPYASIVSYNYNTPVNAALLKSEVERIFRETKDECKWMYTTKHAGKETGLIHYTVWSDVFICNSCGKEFVYWDVALDKENKCIRDEFYCPHCHAMHSKNTTKRAFETIFDDYLGKTVPINKSVPAILVYSVGNKRFEKEVDDFDRDLITKINNTKNNYFVPAYLLPEGAETQRNVRIGITSVHQFYTNRNLIALSLFFEKIRKTKLPNKIKFIFTGMINRSTKMNRIHVSNYFYGGGGWNAGHLKGTLYIPSLPVETSILEQIEDKLKGYLKAIPLLPLQMDNCLYVGSAKNINIKDNSVDYIFTDPPFGANLPYSELNFLPEAWLRVTTNNRSEAIVNPSQEKDLRFYLDMMTECYREYFRILKPGKWMTVEFSNTNASIWNIIQQALTRAGFVVANVSILNKGQGGMRSITTTTAVKQDLVISCYKPSKRIQNMNNTNLEKNIWNFVEEHLERLSPYIIKNNKLEAVAERDQRIIYDRVISYFIQHGLTVPMDALEFQKGLRERFIERDRMFFTASQALDYEDKKAKISDFVPMALFISSEIEGIEWLKRKLQTPQTYNELQPQWMKDMATPKKGDRLPGLDEILEENFIKDSDGKWRNPDAEKAADLEILRNKKMMKEFNLYLEQALKPKNKRIKNTRLEVLRYGFRECYKQKNYRAIVTIGNHIQESLLQEDEILLQYYDRAITKV
ncbi:DNA methyltransferase [Parabacteroides pacaensis]|uniref:DNA methyltransferase n=1 Tax=Parabacteroides pacaensis TaxID=2086575 RepID=UPI000D106008|nr:DNA methyltransferase [Parabacteroides pacaensis]